MTDKCIACIANDARVAIDLEHTCDLGKSKLDKASPERVFLRACHPESPNQNCSWDVDEDREGSIAYVPESALATVRKETFKTAAGIATMMAAGETYETGRQKALNIAAALERAADKNGENDG